MRNNYFLVLVLWVVACCPGAFCDAQTRSRSVAAWSGLREVNEVKAPEADRVQAIVGATLIDGLGGEAVEDSVVVVRGAKIIAVGAGKSTPIPADAEIFDARGLTLLPGLIDSHFHIGSGPNTEWPALLLAGGVTSMRDPGRPIPIWDFVKEAKVPMPRCFLTGPHFDNAPPAYPKNAIILTDAKQTRDAVNRFVDQGASAIKIYYRLPLDLIEVACATAQARGVPVTAHLELTRADRAIEAGLNGVEHITSFGTSLADPVVAARFEAAVGAENNARKAERPELWATLDLDHSPRVKPLIDLIVAKGVVVSPTLTVWDAHAGDGRASEVSVRGFKNMMKFVGLCHQAGAPIVVGSHGKPPNAFCRELELLVECGLTPMEALLAGTKNNAAFFGAQDRIGSVEPGKLADLILVDGDPLKDISAMRQVRRVMLNGLWVKR